MYGCYTSGMVGIYEIQLACIMCMGLNMRYIGHKRVKKIISIHLAPPQSLLKVLVYLTLIHFSRKYSFLKYTHISTLTWLGILKYSTLKKSPHAQIRQEMLSDFNPQLPHLIWDAIICKT